MTTTHKQLRTFIDRIERLEFEKAGLMGDIKDIYEEAKSQGFDVKAMRIVVRRRKKSRSELEEEDSVVETYEAAIESGDAV